MSLRQTVSKNEVLRASLVCAAAIVVVFLRPQPNWILWACLLIALAELLDMNFSFNRAYSLLKRERELSGGPPLVDVEDNNETT